MANIKPHIYEVGEVVNGLKIIEQRRIQQRGRTRKGYLVQSVVYPTAPTYEIEECNLKKVLDALMFRVSAYLKVTHYIVTKKYVTI